MTAVPPSLENELRDANEIVYKHSLELARLKKELETANAQQENLLHFISHEIKGYLTDGQDAFASIAEGDFDGTPAPLVAFATTALAKMRAGVATVMNILDATDFKKGTVTYKREPYDFAELVTRAVHILEPKAHEKGLSITVAMSPAVSYTAVGDREKIEQHVVRNLIDNAIRYTVQGSITVTLTDGQNLRFSVKDTGVGITPEDKERLFTEGGHGKDSIKMNVDSTGYGLYIAKQVVEAHHGKIWAESAGAGRGSEFIVELPIT
jgi:signal transduction histidine kinase